VEEEALRWVEAHVARAGPVELVHDKPWSRVWRVPLAASGAAWFKACAPIQAFEPALTAALHRRWPDRVVELVAHDIERAWLLLADAGTPVGAFGNAPEAWLAALPRYAELQREEARHLGEHLDAGVTDRRLALLPALYDDMLARDLPLGTEEMDGLSRIAPAFAQRCAALAGSVPETIEHSDLHLANVYAKGGRILFVDWGDTAVAHPFFSLARADDEWDDRARAAYLEPWGPGLEAVLEQALPVGSFVYAFGFLRLLDHLDGAERDPYRAFLPRILRRAYERWTSAFSSTSTRRGFEPS